VISRAQAFQFLILDAILFGILVVSYLYMLVANVSIDASTLVVIQLTAALNVGGFVVIWAYMRRVAP